MSIADQLASISAQTASNATTLSALGTALAAVNAGLAAQQKQIDALAAFLGVPAPSTSAAPAIGIAPPPPDVTAPPQG